jgi:hypothetical protein
MNPSSELIKATEKAGTRIAKDKLLELIRKSPEREFTFTQATAKTLVIVVQT